MEIASATTSGILAGIHQFLNQCCEINRNNGTDWLARENARSISMSSSLSLTTHTLFAGGRSVSTKTSPRSWVRPEAVGRGSFQGQGQGFSRYGPTKASIFLLIKLLKFWNRENLQSEKAIQIRRVLKKRGQTFFHCTGRRMQLKAGKSFFLSFQSFQNFQN